MRISARGKRRVLDRIPNAAKEMMSLSPVAENVQRRNAHAVRDLNCIFKKATQLDDSLYSLSARQLLVELLH